MVRAGGKVTNDISGQDGQDGKGGGQEKGGLEKAGEGRMIRFGLKVNREGKPQVSLAGFLAGRGRSEGWEILRGGGGIFLVFNLGAIASNLGQ